jgi:hypothetical protein
MSLIAELKRRNVFRVAVAYAVIAWVLAQVADLAFDNFGAPDWVPKSVLFVLLLGFPLAIFFAWAFEMTPEGVKKEKDVDRSESITSQTGRKLDFLIIGVLVIAVGLLLVDKFVLREVALPVSAEYNRIDELRNVIDWIAGGYFSSGDAELFRPIVDSLLYHDEYLLFADYESYLNAQMDAEVAYADQERWTRMSILNTARCGFFSSDRAMLEYNRDIWKASLLVLPENL